ncbi:MAG: Na+/H+ antiporter subunit G [Erythrobacter sp.]|uniref:Na+/H+ antiporter subunit G n=1 Tax=Erythrobacter sp. HL-111 TaxID=1798193 RepID=UPI0006D94FF1|nr:Na+/H+ antiporter subunit G [Erythrobacter sp. HL-111]KPP84944.1 MAG: multicomponent K+:H+ antiporter subunit PhaG [Erythrobacteraceae bacterium HL-111]SDT08307.1 multisubunit potassium/proton antiporter, PhaG subunit [Erythrobacter sp. HL-111]
MSPLAIQIADAVIAALILIGAAFALVGSWGLVRLPSLMTRLHGPTKATTLGVGGILLASMVYWPVHEGRYTFHELLITIFLFIAAPITANMIAKAHLHRQGNCIDPNPADDIREGLPKRDRWATFTRDD